MRFSAFREYGTLIALCTSGSLNLLLPLYLTHLGYPVATVGLIAGLSAVATLLSRIPVPLVYRPHLSAQLLIATSIGGAVTSVILPLCSDLPLFIVVLVVNRVLSGFAATIIMARFMDGLSETTDRRRAMGWFGGTQAVGYSLASLAVGLLVDLVSYPAGFLYGAAGWIIAAVLLVGQPNPVPIPTPTRGAPSDGVSVPRSGWWAQLADPGLWRVLNASTWNNVFHNVQVTFFPVLALAMGFSATEVGFVRSAYAAVNAVGRPLAGFILARLTLRQASYLGIVTQAALLFSLPFMPSFVLLTIVSLLAGAGRAVVVVATSAGLAEDVDETRVSRGTATATYSTTGDIGQISAPLVAGFVAAALGVPPMFPIMAVLSLAAFLGADRAIERWRRAERGRAPSITEATSGEAVLSTR